MTKKRCILIVEDEPDLREILRDEFESIGYDVMEAENGRRAYELFQSRPCHVILSDIRMPNGNGIELLDRIRQDHPKMPLIFLISGYSDIDRETAFKKGVNGFFNKPFDLDDVRLTITDGVDKAEG